MNAPSILGQLRTDHRRVLRDLTSVERRVPHLGPETPARSAARPRARAPRPSRHPEVRKIVARLGRQFATHMAAEEFSLFPALAQVLPDSRASLEPLCAEHAELRALLASLATLLDASETAEREEQFVVQWRDLAALLRIHVRKEEAVVFRVAERILTPRELARVKTLRFPGRPAIGRHSRRTPPKDTSR
jgi:hypothetical protein